MNPSHSPSVSFIVLALNEEALIESTVRELRTAVRESGVREHEIVLVDDGSIDKTGEIMDRLASSDPRIKVVHNPWNFGVGGAYKQGVSVATGDYIIHIAGDDIMPASDTVLLLAHLGEADLLLGYMTNPRLRPLGRRIGSKGFTILINIIFGLRVRYYQNTFPRRELLQKIDIKTDSHAFLAEMGVKLLKSGCSYVEVGIHSTPSRTGNSVALQPRRLLAVFKAIMQIFRDVYFPDHKASLPAKPGVPLK